MLKSYHKTSDKFRAEGSNQHAKIAWRLFKRNLLNFTIDIDEKYRRLKRRRLREATEILNMNRNPTARSLQEKEWAKAEINKQQFNRIRNSRVCSQYRWLRDGEHPNKLFFQVMKQREKQNMLPLVNHQVGTQPLPRTHDENKEAVSDSYRQTFTRRVPDANAMDEVRSAVNSVNRKLGQISKAQIEEATNLDMQNHCTSDAEHIEEHWIYKTICNLAMYKAPGADGIPNEFYYIFRRNPYLLDLLHDVYCQSVTTGFDECMSTTYYKQLAVI